jgi:hypothetical protein
LRCNKALKWLLIFSLSFATKRGLLLIFTLKTTFGQKLLKVALQRRSKVPAFLASPCWPPKDSLLASHARKEGRKYQVSEGRSGFAAFPSGKAVKPPLRVPLKERREGFAALPSQQKKLRSPLAFGRLRSPPLFLLRSLPLSKRGGRGAGREKGLLRLSLLESAPRREKQPSFPLRGEGKEKQPFFTSLLLFFLLERAAPAGRGTHPFFLR